MQPVENTDRTKRLVGLSLVLLASSFFVLIGFTLSQRPPAGSCDFGAVYYPTRFLVQHQDPYVYLQSSYLAFKAQGYLQPGAISVADRFYIPCVYPPTALLVTAPLALLPWHSADLVWLTVSAASLVIGAILTWTLAADSAPLFAGALIGFILVNSITVLFEANAAGPAVGLCAVAVALFLKNRFSAVAIICLAISLCLKPHDGGLVWLFLLVSGGVLRRRALQTLLAVALLAIPAVLWVSHLSPDWPRKLSGNIASLSARGGINDPGPTTYTSHVTNSAVNLQTFFSVFVDRPGFYNAATYLVCTILLLWLLWMTVRATGTVAQQYLGLAAVTALAMLPLYHRHHDARLLLLAVPACAILWTQRSILGKIGVLIATVSIAVTGDIPRAILENLDAGHHFTVSTLSGKLQMILFNRPAALALLIMTVYFLWLYTRRLPEPTHSEAGSPQLKAVQLG
ncbi:glycosyltransferase family 87 protein [Occallatibacter savannae]|uniref:glycosyltransferase family 87 protein n=1 Tax=Occallatibacter savannae TaxID=1002691 RepID=UPI000D688D37|nr:glycosyltransferase family 87 protein [Occallatibacter savannae]